VSVEDRPNVAAEYMGKAGRSASLLFFATLIAELQYFHAAQALGRKNDAAQI
jgi:hypothetical protein